MALEWSLHMYDTIRELVDSLCREGTDVPLT